MVRTHFVEDHLLDIPETSVGRGQALHASLHGPVPPPRPPCPLVILEPLLATQNELMKMLVENDARRGAGRPQHPRHQDMDSSYSDFLATHLPLFSEPTDPMEVDKWLHTTESKFGLLHCTKYENKLYAIQ
jgi:hypothetical protein